MNYKRYVVKRLKTFEKNNIIITPHAMIRIVQRQINPKEVIENIINPVRLEYAIQEKATTVNEEKFDCYFGYSKTLCHRYVIVIKNNVVVVTVVKINRRWQRIVEKKMKYTKYE
ncbi:MAG: hypothetical protein KJ583_02300 [Nanoarchaeota archaeon]|nr:hypothetical protein [Nanoarchaeota archaeon]MBU1269748.1 hypothetical protein [Nanoarchaeota archaeon]MBU1604126.1 hypothetical protein [Nanoarchaeota archaeon]MBU2443919.1 hypothetical protein [Nanoarchaeota archaeon]